MVGKEAGAKDVHQAATVICIPSISPSISLIRANESHISHSVSISLPASPSGYQLLHTKRVHCNDTSEKNCTNGLINHPPMDSLQQRHKHGRFHSLLNPATEDDAQMLFRGDRPMDRRFDSFKTWSGKLEKQISLLRGKVEVEPEEVDCTEIIETQPLPAIDRYFDALEGPELDTLKSSERLILPVDKKWPFLLRFPISSFGICLGVSSQAMLWKTLATSPSMDYLHISLAVNRILWCISLALMAIVSCVYLLKIIFYFEAVRREYYHPIRVNFFFAPWITCLFLSIGMPPSVTPNLHGAIWYVQMAPILCLELKIYGQWMSGGQRRLSKVANPSNHLAIVGNFVGALMGASIGLKEGPIFFFAVGLAHYIVLFVTLYQRLPTNETLPRDLHPVFFLFVAAPSVASLAWAEITDEFGFGSRIAYFVALFLYISLAVRVNFFRGFRFSLSWWAYTFPMTGASIATIRYATEVGNLLTQTASISLSVIATLTVLCLLVSTIIHAFVLSDLFPNDIAIAITERKPKGRNKRAHPV